MFKEHNKYIINLDSGMYGYFTTEWYSLWKETKEREDLDTNIKSVICKMYSNVLNQVWSQELGWFKEIKDNDLFNEFYTEEFVEKMIEVLEKQIKEIN